MKTMQELRPGDIMLGPIGGLVGLAVGLGQLALGEAFRSGTLSVRHIGVVVQGARPTISLDKGVDAFTRPLLAQAMPGGAEIIGMDAGHWTDRHAYVRLPEDYPGQAEDAAAVARLMVEAGVAYSWASYASLSAYRLGIRNDRLKAWINRRRMPLFVQGSVSGFGVQLPREAICSVFADQAWSLTGKRIVEGGWPQAVTPGKLADTLSCLDGATWCRPRANGVQARVYTI